MDDYHRREIYLDQNASSSGIQRDELNSDVNRVPTSEDGPRGQLNPTHLIPTVLRQPESKDKFCATAEFPNSIVGKVATVGTVTTQSQTGGCQTVSHAGYGGHYLPRNSSSPVITTVGSGHATGKEPFSSSELQEAMEAMCDKIRVL